MQINGTNIQLIRGDNATLTVRIQNPDGTHYPFQKGDTVYFTVKRSPAMEQKTLQKVIREFTAEGAAEIELFPEDTKPLSFGVYYYDIQWTKANGVVQTLLAPSLFQLMQEVTYE